MTVAEAAEPAIDARAANRPRWLRRGLIGLAGALLITGALVTAYKLQPKHLRTVVPGVLYRSATLPPEQLSEVVDRYGIRTVVNLRSQLENDKGGWHSTQAAALESKGVEMVDLPMHTGFPPEDTALESWLDVVADPDRHPILVHCEYGVVRTSAMVAVFEMEYLGLSNEEAWSDYELFGGDLPPVIEERMSSFIEGYEPRGVAREAVGP